MKCINEKCLFFNVVNDANCSAGDDVEYAEECIRGNYCYFEPADLPEAGASAERISSVVRSNATDGWISVKDKLPSCKNGYVDRLVLICVKNKNKPDGIYLQDVCRFDGEEWSKRFHTWEEILFWMPLPEPPKEDV